ncbi:MAG: class I SAM-dependent methyltransferase [Candidatus Bipolaricaulia bacterium]
MIDRDTIEYYDQFAADFANRTMDINLPQRDRFVSLLSSEAVLLDLGCGPGRDLKYFSLLGHSVYGLDPSWQFAIMARTYSSCPVVMGHALQMPFIDRTFAGIWACASLLHVSKHALPSALREVHRLLRPGGLLFLSMKEGNGEVRRKSRLFALYQLDELTVTLQDVDFHILEVRLDPPLEGQDENWINVFARTNESPT